MLELCLQAFRANADWAGFSCRSTRISHNRLSEVEADMYEADTEYGMTVHPWRKILDACFVTRREAYEECGGFKPEFGHFSEWVLAASYFEHGYKIGYLPEARIHHYYIGSLAELKTFTLDFVQGEFRYFSRDPREPGSAALEAPSELICDDNFAPDMARGILRMAVQDVIASSVAGGRWRAAMFAIGRWTSPAIFGDGIARAAGAGVALYAYCVLLLASAAGSRQWLGVRFRIYIAAWIHYQRLTCIRTERLSRAAAGSPDAATGPGRNAILDQTGFYGLEKYQDTRFRWSENAAAIRIRVDAGRQSIRIKCLSVRKPTQTDARFFLDGKRVPDGAVSTGAGDFEIWIALQQSGTCELGWSCRPFRATGDSRRLGLPITGVELASRTGHVMVADVNSQSLHA